MSAFVGRLKDFLSKLGAERARDQRIRISGLGHCPRKLKYQLVGEEGERLGWRGVAIFSDGDNIQDQVRGWLKDALKGSGWILRDEELEVTVTTPKGRNVVGHVDGVLAHREEGERLLEVKSMNQRAYKDFERGILEDSYRVQVCAYMAALGLRKATVIAKSKNTAEMAEMEIDQDDALVLDYLSTADTVIDADAPEHIERPYAPNASGFLPWQCGYCPYWRKCWAGLSPVEKEPHKIRVEFPF